MRINNNNTTLDYCVMNGMIRLYNEPVCRFFPTTIIMREERKKKK